MVVHSTSHDHTVLATELSIVRTRPFALVGLFIGCSISDERVAFPLPDYAFFFDGDREANALLAVLPTISDAKGGFMLHFSFREAACCCHDRIFFSLGFL